MSVPETVQPDKSLVRLKTRLIKEANALCYRLHDLTVALDAEHPVCADTLNCAICERRRHAMNLKKISFLRIQRRCKLPTDPRPVLPKYLVRSRIRFQVFERAGYRCQMCGRDASEGVRLEVDHITPRSKGGKDTAENYQLLCQECNIGKRDSLISTDTLGKVEIISTTPPKRKRITHADRAAAELQRLAEWRNAA